MQFTEYSPMDIDMPDDDDQPICICEDFYNAVHPTYCRMCNMWTDDKELLMAEPIEQAMEEAA